MDVLFSSSVRKQEFNMKITGELHKGVFLERLNRFVAKFR